MSIIDIVNGLHTRLAEEISDAETYLEMAKEAEKMNQEDLSRHLFEIAYEEYTHARFIARTMCNYGISVAKDVWDKWSILENRFEHMSDI